MQTERVDVLSNAPGPDSGGTTVLEATGLSPAFYVRIYFISDWHIGQGAGRPGEIDRLVQRDPEQLPWVPGKTLVGIWRDACEQVAFGLDDGEEDGRFARYVAWLFGDQPALSREARLQAPLPAALSVRAARLPQALRDILLTRPRLREAVTFVKPGVAIDAATGGAKNQHLHFDELVRGGTVLEAPCKLDLEGDEADVRTAVALLLAGASFIERLGGKRRRGAGRVELEVVGAPGRKTWTSWLEQALIRTTAPLLVAPAKTEGGITPGRSGGWMRLELKLIAETPLIIPAKITGNEVETLDYLPGSYLLPHLSRAWAPSGIDLAQAIARGDLMVLDGTLAVEGRKGLPTPLPLFHPKGEKGLEEGRRVWNRLVEPDPSSGPGGTAPLRTHPDGWIGDDAPGSLPPFARPQKGMRMHNTIADEVQRPITEIGGLYCYQALQAGTVLRSEVRVRVALVEQLKRWRSDWWDTLFAPPARLTVGRSRKDDYGLVHIQPHGAPALMTPAAADARQVTVWLLSNLLLRDERLRPLCDPDGLARALSARLGVPLRVVISHAGHHTALVRTFRLESWQSRWGLPRPSLIGLAAGSCVMLEVDPTAAGVKPDTRIPGHQLAMLEAEGLGERRAEGYGQVRFDPPLLASATSSLTRVTTAQSEVAGQAGSDVTRKLEHPLDQKASEYLWLIETEAWRSAIQLAALHQADTESRRREILGVHLQDGRSSPSLSRLGSLRSTVRRIRSLEDREIARAQIAEFMKAATDTGSTEVASRLRALLDDPEVVWKHLAIPRSELAASAAVAEKLSGMLWAEALRSLIDAILSHHRRLAEDARGKVI